MKFRIIFYSAVFFHICFSACNENNPEKSQVLADTSTVTDDTAKLSINNEQTQNQKNHFELTNCELKMSDEATALIEKKFPGFRCWEKSDFSEDCGNVKTDYKCTDKSAPFAVIGDFNSDSINDIVLSGQSEKNDIIFCMISDKNEDFIFKEIYKSGRTVSKFNYDANESRAGFWIMLEHQPPEKIKSHWEKDTLNLKTDGFHIVYCGKASELYYSKNNKMITYQISD